MGNNNGKDNEHFYMPMVLFWVQDNLFHALVYQLGAFSRV